MMVVAMIRRLAIVGVLGGCGFSVSAGESTATPDASTDGTSVPVDGAPDLVDAMRDASTGSEVVPMQVTTELTSVADIYLRTAAAPDQNTNGSDYFIIDGDVTCTGLVRFDLSSIPVGATIDAAELLLWNDNDGGDTCTVHQMLEAWDEASATSNQRAAGQAWLGTGATPPSRTANLIGSFTPATANTSYTSAIATAVVQSWVASPAANHGVAIVTSSSNGSRFKTRETAMATRRPLLRVTYTY
jgi:hypothetical protein